jgi:hypothetical protein
VTPLIPLDRIAPDLWMKDEGRGPTGCWLDRYPQRTVGFDELLRPPPLSIEAIEAIRDEVAQELGSDVLIVSDFAVPPGSLRVAIDSGLEVLRVHGFLPSIRGAIALFARPKQGRVVVINPESGLRDLHVYARSFPGGTLAETNKLGGLITPR